MKAEIQLILKMKFSGLKSTQYKQKWQKKKKSNVFLSITDEAQMSLGLKDPTQRLTWEGPLRDSALRDAQVSFAVNSNFN